MGLYSLTTWVTYCKIAVPANLSTMYVAGLNLHSRDAIVAVPSQRRNSFSPLRPARQHRPRPQERLKSGNGINIIISIIYYLLSTICNIYEGIYYVDDPHGTFREQTPAQDRISGGGYCSFID